MTTMSSCCVHSVLWSAAVLLETRRKRKHSVWIKQYLRDRAKYGVFNTLLPELATHDFQRWLHYLRTDLDTFQELLLRIEPKIVRKKTNYR